MKKTYKPLKVRGRFNDNYIEYENRGDRKDKDKNLSVKEYLYKIMPYLHDMIVIIKLSLENGKFSYQCKSILFLLKILEKHVLCLME